MLPAALDLSTMQTIMLITIAAGVLIGLITIKAVDKPMLRVFICVLIGVLCLSAYSYYKMLNTCEKNSTKCTFFGAEVPQDGGFIS